MKLLIFEPAYQRIKDRLEGLAPTIEPLLLHPDSTLSFKGAPVAFEDAEFDIAFASNDPIWAARSGRFSSFSPRQRH